MPQILTKDQIVPHVWYSAKEWIPPINEEDAFDKENKTSSILLCCGDLFVLKFGKYFHSFGFKNFVIEGGLSSGGASVDKFMFIDPDYSGDNKSINIKRIDVTKSEIEQMEYEFPFHLATSNYNKVIGWVSINPPYRTVLVEKGGKYFKTDCMKFVTPNNDDIEKVTEVTIEVYLDGFGRKWQATPGTYRKLLAFVNEIQEAGQVYYR